MSPSASTTATVPLIELDQAHVIRGQVRVLRYADISMNLDEHKVERQGVQLQVSPIGWRILQILLRNAPHVVSKQQLMQEIWGDEVPDSNSLKVHLFHLH